MNRLILTFVCLLGIFSLQAQTRNKQYEEYIKKYRDIAVEEMKKYHIDLTAAILKTLEKEGVQNIEIMENCTVCESETFFSHRKTGGRRGCFGAVIVRKE